MIQAKHKTVGLDADGEQACSTGLRCTYALVMKLLNNSVSTVTSVENNLGDHSTVGGK